MTRGHAMNTNDKIYFTTLPSDSSVYIAIEHGTEGYNKTDVSDQAHADVLNKRQSITREDCQAAIVCSMTGHWEKFDEIVQNTEIRHAEKKLQDHDWKEVWRHKRNRKYYQVVHCENNIDATVYVTALLGGADGTPYGPSMPRTREVLRRLYTQHS